MKLSNHFDILGSVVLLVYDPAEIPTTGQSAMDTKTTIAALAALAQESRLAVFRLLVQAAPAGLAASRISEHLDIAPSSLSFHLKELTHAGLLSSRQDGRFVIYTANVDTVNGLIAFLTENCCGGMPCAAPAGDVCKAK